MRILLLIVGLTGLLGICVEAQSEKFTISGRISNNSSGEDLINATVYVNEIGKATTSNLYGFYSLTLEAGNYEVTYSFLGFKEIVEVVELTQDLVHHVELTENTSLLGEVVISAEREEEAAHVTSTIMGVNNVRMESVKKLPALFGEVDIIKAIQLLPGVQMVGEGSSGFYVRGGNADQNLVLLDEAPVYNPSHLFGFFSAFNSEIVKDMKLYKGAVPSRYGGRLSSVLDIRMKDGNSKSFGASGGIGTIMTRLALEAPLGDKGSIIISGRRSYLDLIAKAFFKIKGGNDFDGRALFFYDLNAKANYKLSEKDRLYASGYFGRDVLRDKSEGIELEWGNATSTFRWNHIFSPKLFSNITYYYSNYNYALDFEEDLTKTNWKSRLQEHSIKADFGAYLSPENTLRFGFQSILHDIDPGDITSFQNNEQIGDFKIQRNKSYENAVYISHEHEVNDKIKINYGIRLSSLFNIGPQDVYKQNSEYEIIDTVTFNKGIYHTAWNLEPRFGARYNLSPSSSVKISYNRMTQYIQLASNGNAATPFDIWFTSSSNIKPQIADQLGIGYFQNLGDNVYELSVEAYFKKYKNAIDFKDHARLLLNDNIEGELRVGEVRSYGMELMLKKNKGDLTGWISYSYSKAEKKIATINDHQWYNAKYDKPHDFAIVLSYDISSRLSIGSNFIYSTGGAVTFPTGSYDFLGTIVPQYSRRNGSRLPDYHRMDVSLTLRSKKNSTRRFQSEWVFSVYNVYNRKNAFSINFKQEPGTNITYAEKASIFSLVPSVTWNAKF